MGGLVPWVSFCGAGQGWVPGLQKRTVMGGRIAWNEDRGHASARWKPGFRQRAYGFRVGAGRGQLLQHTGFLLSPSIPSDPIEQPKPGRRWGGPNYCWWTQGFPSVAAHQKCLGDPQRNYSVLGCNSGNSAVGQWSRESVFQQPRPLGLSGHGIDQETLLGLSDNVHQVWSMPEKPTL